MLEIHVLKFKNCHLIVADKNGKQFGSGCLINLKEPVSSYSKKIMLRRHGGIGWIESKGFETESDSGKLIIE